MHACAPDDGAHLLEVACNVSAPRHILLRKSKRAQNQVPSSFRITLPRQYRAPAPPSTNTASNMCRVFRAHGRTLLPRLVGVGLGVWRIIAWLPIDINYQSYTCLLH